VYDTKADFDAAYEFRVERYLGGHPNTRPEVIVHYHKKFMASILSNMWATLQPILQIGSTEQVCVFGAGFGWGVEAITAETGATVVGIDISQYIADEQGTTEEAEIRAEIAAVGLDPDGVRGQEIITFLEGTTPRANVIVLQNDASTGPQRNEIRTALGGNNPSVCIAEDLIDDTWTDTDVENLRNAMNGFGGPQRLIFIYRATPTRSHQNLFDLLPGTKEVISPDGSVYLS